MRNHAEADQSAICRRVPWKNLAMSDPLHLPLLSMLTPAQQVQIAQIHSCSGWRVCSLPCLAWQTPAIAYLDIAKALQFEPEFGNNLDALADALGELAERYPGGTGLLLLLTDYSRSALRNSDWHQNFVMLLRDSCDYWREQGRQLNVLQT